MENISPQPAFRIIFELAKVDGWYALYDPSNPTTRRISNGHVVSISDSLGNLPDAVAENIDSGPLWDETAFHGLGAATYGIDGASELRSSEVTPSLNQPLFIMTLAQLATSSPSELGRYLVDGVSPTQRHVIFASPGSPNQWATYSGTKFATLSALDTEPHVLGYQINGAYEPSGSTMFIDGSLQVGYIRGSNSQNTHSFSGLTIGNHQKGGSGRHWVGNIGPILIYRGIPSESIRERMTRTLWSFTTAIGQRLEDTLLSRSAVLMRANGDLVSCKNPDRLETPASLTKMLTAYLARQTITDERLDETITLTDDDNLTGSAPALYPGDEISYRNLFYLAMLPSHNVAAELLASRVGAQLSGTGSGRERFIAKMGNTVAEWGWDNAIFTNASGLGTSNRATARQMGELLWRIAHEDALLLSIMGELRKDIAVAGSNPRTITAVHSIRVRGTQRFSEFIAGKTGTLFLTGGNVAMLVGNKEREVIVTMGALPANKRYSDARMILDRAAEHTVARSPEITDTENKVTQILQDPHSLLRKTIENIRPTSSLSQPMSINIPGADLSATGARVVLSRSGQHVELLIAAAKVPANASVPGIIPSGFRPHSFAFGLCTVRDGDSVRTVEVGITSTGRITFHGNTSSDILRGTVHWLADAD